MSLAKFDRIEEISPGDNLAVVQPGVRLDMLNEELAKFGYFYPPSPKLHYIAVGKNHL